MKNIESAITKIDKTERLELQELLTKVGIVLLHGDKYMPKKAHESDASYDVYAAEVRWENENAIAYGLGFKLELERGIRADLKARSSIYKTGMILSNGIGTGDPGFKGEYGAVFYKITPNCKPYQVGERIGQISFEKIREVNFDTSVDLSHSDRGEGGYGSSGRF